MNVEFTARFLRALDELPPREQAAVLRAVDRAQENRRHPSLQTKRIQGTSGIWEMRASRDLRLTFTLGEDRLTFRMCGHHDDALRQP